MVIKEILYKGKKAEELKRMSMPELFPLLDSDARRKVKRLTDADRKFLAKVEKANKPIKTHLRAMVVLPVMIGKQIMIHNGKAYEPVVITEEMIGHRLGEYAMTRRRVQHNAPGIGATRSSASQSVK